MSEIKSLLQDIEELELLNEELLEKATRYLVQRDELKLALNDFIVYAEEHDWDKSITGRQIILSSAKKAITLSKNNPMIKKTAMQELTELLIRRSVITPMQKEHCDEKAKQEIMDAIKANADYTLCTSKRLKPEDYIQCKKK